MNHRRSGLILACLACIAALVAPRLAHGQYIASGSHYTPNPDFNSGQAYGWASGLDMIPTFVTTNTNYYLDTSSNQFYVSAGVTIWGNWKNPSIPQNYIDHIVTNQLNSYAYLSLSRFEWNGQYYDLESPVYFSNRANVQVLPNTEPWLPADYQCMFQMNTDGTGAIPIASIMDVQIIDQSTAPYQDADFRLQYESRWLITSAFHPIPTPTSGAAVLGLAGLVAVRRRR